MVARPALPRIPEQELDRFFTEIGALSNRPTDVVREHAMARSRHLRAGEFEVLDSRDLRLLFDLYDEHAFGGVVSRWLPRSTDGAPALRIRLSNRMSRAAGTTTFRMLRPTPDSQAELSRVEIAFSVPLLVRQLPTGENARVVGLACRDRLDVLQRVMEHEIVHVFEHLATGRSRCSGPRFQAVAGVLFGHTDFRHALGADAYVPDSTMPAPPVRRGDRVRFDFRGEIREGFVNRVTARATVLVPDPDGERYSDGRRYLKYYVPLQMLRPVANRG